MSQNSTKMRTKIRCTKCSKYVEMKSPTAYWGSCGCSTWKLSKVIE